MKKTSVSKDVEYLELSNTAAGSISWYNNWITDSIYQSVTDTGMG